MNFNYALILFWLLVLTGGIWLLDILVLKRRRLIRAEQVLRTFDAQLAGRSDASAALSQEREQLRQKALQQSGWIEFFASAFPVILVVFVLRSFLFEPFRIPSGSMMPTLLIGDFILVNKFTYGIRLPVLNKKIIDINQPQRGDIMVFRYPKDPSFDYIKRVIGLPGDTVTYRKKRLEINGKAVPTSATVDYFDAERVSYFKQLSEKLPNDNTEVEHKILNDDNKSSVIEPDKFNYDQNCTYPQLQEEVTCVVPSGHYFVMGDNRDNSLDSRFWGFVPEQNIVGRAFFIWMNFSSTGRIGSIH